MKFKDLNIGDKFISKTIIDDTILYIKISHDAYKLLNEYNALAIFNKEYPKGFMGLEDEVIKCM